MATATTPKTPKAPKVQVALAERVKTQITAAALKAKVSVEELEMLEQHFAKLRSILS